MTRILKITLLTYRFPSTDICESLIKPIGTLAFPVPALHRFTIVAEKAINFLQNINKYRTAVYFHQVLHHDMAHSDSQASDIFPEHK